MSGYKSIELVYLVKFINGPFALLEFYDIDEQSKHVDFVIILKKNLLFTIDKCNKQSDPYGNKYDYNITFNTTLTVDNIDSFKLSPGLWNQPSYLKQIYDGQTFDMTKLNNIVVVSYDFINNKKIFEKTQFKLKKKGISSTTWITIILLVMLGIYFYFEYTKNNK